MLPDGTLRNVRIVSHPVLDASGKVVEFVGTVMDVTEQKRAEEERREHLWFLESMDRINRAMQRMNDVEGVMSGVLEETLAIFGSDRAWLVYPCDPDAATSRVVMEHTRPEYPGAFALGEEFPVDAQGAELLRRVLDGPGAVTDLSIPPEIRERFSIQSMIAIAVRPKGDRPYLFGMTQCSHARAWTAAERRLFEEIARRLEDALTSVLAHRNLLAREEELRRSQHYLSEAQKLSHTGSWAVNLSSNAILYWSEECYRIYAYDPAQGLPSFESAVERVHPEDRPAVMEAVGKAVRERADFQTEHRVILPGGIVRHIRCLANAAPNASGELVYIGTVMDVTDQKRAEEALGRSGAALKLSEERYALAMEAAADGHLDWNFLTGEFYISPRLLKIVGHPPDAIFTDRADWVRRFPFHPEDRKRWEKAIAAHFAGRDAKFKMDLRIVVDGETRWTAFNFIATRDAAGKVVRWTGSIADIDDAKRDVATVVDGIPGLVAILAPGGDVEAVSGQLVEYCGQPLEAMRQWGTNGTVHPYDVPRIVEPFTRAISAGEPYEFDARVRRFDGVYRWHQICGVPVRAAGGAIVRWYSVLADIDDRKRALEELRVSESRFRALVELNAGGFWEQDENFRYLPTTFLHHVTGYSNEERIGKTRWELPGDLTPLSGSWDEHKADLEAHRPFRDFEYRRVRKDGRIGYYSASGVPIFDDQGVFKGYYGVLNDITERLLAASALRASEERYALAVAGSDDGIWDVDFAAQRVFVSARTRELTGMPPGPDIVPFDEGFACWSIHPEDMSRRTAALQAHLEGTTPAYVGEFRLRQPDGVYRWRRLHGLCSRDADGKPLRMAGSISDVDARRRAEDGLRESEERYALAVAGSDDGVWDIDFAAARVFISARARELAGMPPGPEIVPLEEWSASLPLHPDDVPMRIAAMEAHLTGKTPAYEGEYRLRQPDGVYRWRRIHGLCLRNAEGKPQRMAGSISDVDARRRAEDGLRESEKRYERVMLAAEAGFWDWDVPADKVYISPKLLEMTGFPPGTEFESRSDFSARAPFYPGDWAKWESAVNELFASGGTRLTGELRTIHGAEIRWYELSGMCVRDPAGKVQRWTGSATYMTARKRAEEALREQTERLQLGQAAMRMIIMDWNVAEDLLTWSDSPEWLRGPMPASGSYPLFQDQVHPDDRDSFVASRRRALETLQVQTTEFRLVRTDGEVIWVLERKRAFAGADGKAVRMLAAMFDITDRKRAEEALRRREEELQRSETHLAEAQRVSHTGSWAWSPATDVRYWSEECYRIQGFDPARGLPSLESFVERIHSEDRPGFVEGLDKAVREKMDFEREYRIVHSDGAIRCIHSLAHPVLSSAGDLIEYVGTVMDVTERRVVEAERSRLKERLQQAEKMEAIGRFASGIVHDFSNILGGILAYGEMLFDDAAENTPRKRYAQNVLTAANRGRDLVDQILQYTRSQRGKHKPTDICTTVAETLELVRSSLPARITLCHAIPDAPLVMMGDPTQLHQIVMNLCSNAIHAMKTGGPLRVGVTPIETNAVLALSHGTLQPGSYVRVSVEDSGCGMDEATLGRSFEPFFTTKEFGHGTGLGLALVYAIVTDFEGAIDVKSVPDEGSTFSIYLPSVEAPATVASESRVPLLHLRNQHRPIDEENVGYDQSSKQREDKRSPVG